MSLLIALVGTTLAWAVLHRPGPAGPRHRGRARPRPGHAAAGAGAVRRDTPTASSPSPRSRATCPAPATDILYDHRQVTRNHVDATIRLADDAEAGKVPAPDFVLWPENSTALDPFLDASLNSEIREAVAAVGVPILVGRDHRRPRAGQDPQPGHRLDPDDRGGGPLHQAAPRAVRRVHPLARQQPAHQPLRRAGPGGPRHAGRHPRRAAADRGRRRRGRHLLRRRLRRGDLRSSSRPEPGCSSCRPATRPSAAPASSTSSSRSPGSAPSRPAGTCVVASTNGITGIIAPDGTADQRSRAAHPGLRRRAGAPDVRRAARACGSGPWLGLACLVVGVCALVLPLLPYRRRATLRTPEVPDPALTAEERR